MKTMKRITTLSVAVMFFSVLGMNASFAGKPSGGGGKNVEVTAVAPSDASQGQELDVIISGSGFDSGSEVSFFVTGSDDASQVEVLSVEYLRKTKELKTHIRVKDTAVSSEYDIEVRTSSGRKGKGTTLFKVSSDEVTANPALLISGLSSQSSHIFVADVDGSNLTGIVHNASLFSARAMPTVWAAGGSKIIWGKREDLGLHIVGGDGSNAHQLLAASTSMQPWIGGQRNIAASSKDCSGLNANLLYFLGAILDEEWWHEEFFVLDLDESSPTPLRLTHNKFERHFTLVTSPDDLFVATWTNDEPYDSPSSLNSRLEIRDICAAEMPVVESWTAENLSLPIDSYIVSMSWSAENILAATVRIPGALNEQIYLIDFNLPTESVTAVKIIGDGTGFGEGVENHRVAWSPDGSLLAFVSNFMVYKLDVATGEITFIVDAVSDRDIDWRTDWVAQP